MVHMYASLGVAFSYRMSVSNDLKYDAERYAVTLMDLNMVEKYISFSSEISLILVQKKESSFS